jgi:aminoglycoside phosphotransferase (APT) family kinase protein
MIVGVRMHADEADIDDALVGRLVAGQFPEWADLPIGPVASSGTDNAMFRMGADLAVWLPRIPGAAKDADLAAFISALRRNGLAHAPPSSRGVPLATRDTPTRAAIAASDGLIDTAAVTAVWQDALRIPARPASPPGRTRTSRPATCWSATAASQP